MLALQAKYEGTERHDSETQLCQVQLAPVRIGQCMRRSIKQQASLFALYAKWTTVCVCLSPAAGFDDFGTVLAAAAATPRPPQRPTPSAAADSDGEAAHTLYIHVYVWSGGNTHAALHKADCSRLTCVR